AVCGVTPPSPANRIAYNHGNVSELSTSHEHTTWFVHIDFAPFIRLASGAMVHNSGSSEGMNCRAVGLDVKVHKPDKRDGSTCDWAWRRSSAATRASKL